MAKKDQDLTLTIGVETDDASVKEALDKVKKEIDKNKKKATVKVSASVNDNTSPSRVLPGMSRIKSQKKHDALSFILGEAGGTWERFSTAADYHAGTFSPVQTRNRGYIKEIEIPDPTDNQGKKKIKQKELTAGGLVKHTNAVTDAVDAQIKRENAYARKYNLDTIKQSEREDILAASMLHDRFKYTETGRINPNAMNDAAAWARVGGLNGAFNILSDPNSRGARIISAIDFATSQESRSGDMDENGRWNEDMKKSKLDVLDAAVKSGEGRWKDPDSAHVVDNFEEINEYTQDENKNLEDWRDNLKGVIGDLGIIALLLKAMKGVAKFDKWAEQTIKTNAEHIPVKTWAGLSTEDILAMRAGSGYLNLPTDIIYDSVMELTGKLGQFQTTGEGLDLFSGSVAKGLQSVIANASDPHKAWAQTMDIFIQEATALRKAGKTSELSKLYTNIKNFMGEDAAKIVGKVADKNTNNRKDDDITSIEDLYAKQRYNPFYGELDRADQLNSDMNLIRQSLQASYNAIASDWEEYFGKPFKAWWDKFLQKFIAWYRDFLGLDKPADYSVAAAMSMSVLDPTTMGLFTRHDLSKVKGDGKFTRITSVNKAEKVWDSLPDYMKEMLNEYSANGKFNYKDADTWNLLMAAEKIKNKDMKGNPYADSERATALRDAMENAGITKGGFQGWLVSKYAEAAGVSTDFRNWSDDEAKQFSKYLKDQNVDVVSEGFNYINSRFAAKGSLSGFTLDYLSKLKGGEEYIKRANEFTEAAAGSDESFRKMFSAGGVVDYASRLPGGKNVYVSDYLERRLEDDAAGIRLNLEDEKVTDYERTFAKNLSNVLMDTSISDAMKYDLIDMLIEELKRQYAADGGYYQGRQDEVIKMSGKESGPVAVNITVNGVDTNNANEVAAAVERSTKSALVFESDNNMV